LVAAGACFLILSVQFSYVESVKSDVDQHILVWCAAAITLLIGIGGESWNLEWEKLPF